MQFMTDEGPIDVIEFDGYHIAERLLEGVKFQATIVDNIVVVTVHPDHASYFSKFNQAEWLNQAKKHVLTYDLFGVPGRSDLEAWLEGR